MAKNIRYLARIVVLAPECWSLEEYLDFSVHATTTSISHTNKDQYATWRLSMLCKKPWFHDLARERCGGEFPVVILYYISESLERGYTSTCSFMWRVIIDLIPGYALS